MKKKKEPKTAASDDPKGAGAMTPKKPKPNVQSITRAIALTQIHARPADPITACNVCGKPGESLTLYRECDVHDEPRPGDAARVYLDRAHEECLTTLRSHPRLYVEETGQVGQYPRLCGPCTYREGATCVHPGSKVNGGPGLAIELAILGVTGLICVKGTAAVREAISCSGRVARSTIASSPPCADGSGENKENDDHGQ